MPLYAEIVAQVTHLFCSDAYYRRRPLFVFANSVLPAIRHGKYIADLEDGRIIGFMSYCFLTNEEYEANKWDGEEVFARDSGDILYFSQFCFVGPKRKMVEFVRNIRKEMSRMFPELKTAKSHRVRLDGSMRPERWYRKDTK